MNEFTPQSDVRHDPCLDRLVDGEMSRAEYQECLAALEREPDGWRRCALAFLEAQALARELSGWRSEMAAPVPLTLASKPAQNADDQAFDNASALKRNFPGAPGKAGAGRWRRSDAAWMLAVVAASFLIAFGLGVVVKSRWRTGASALNEVATDGASIPDSPDSPDLDPSPSPNSAPQADAPQLAVQPRRDDRARPTAIEPEGELTLIVDNGGGGEEVRLPLYDPREVDDDWEAERDAAPARFIEALRRAGHQVRRRQSWAPIELDNGGRAVVPVEQLEITPVKRTYQ